MRAGVSSSPATTRSRSSPRPPLERSTMRYCIGLVSGTRDLRKEFLDHLQRFTLAPVALAEYPVTHPPLRVDHERHGKPTHLPQLRRFLLRIEEHRQRELLLCDEGRDFFRKLAEIDGQHRERPSRELRAQALQRGKLVLAGGAPGRPEVHQHDTPAQLLQVNLPSQD